MGSRWRRRWRRPRPRPAGSPGIRFVGIDPTAERILVVKSSIHYRAAFEPLAHTILEVDAPGLSSSNLDRFAFKNVRRPIFPLDDL